MAASVAFAEIEKQAGKQFDPAFAAGFLSIQVRILEEMQNWSSQQTQLRRTRALAL
jgi:hypothetical protein